MNHVTFSYCYTSYSNHYVCDFETSTDAWHLDEARVWLWDAYDVKAKKHINGKSIDTFFTWMSTLPAKSLLTFHNLAYDGLYIIDFALNSGWSAAKRGYNLRFGQFYCVITEYGDHYAYVFRCEHGPIIINDSLKTLRLSVEKVAQAYELPIEKSTIDYDMVRPIGWDATEEELHYIHMDTEIVAQAIGKLLDQGMNRFTMPQNALVDYKRTLGEGNYRAGASKYYELFNPEFSVPYAREAYYGGFTWANPEYKNKELHNVTSYDINSMFPSAMLHYWLPYGPGDYHAGNVCEDLPEGKLALQHISVAYKLKPGHVPSLYRDRMMFTGDLHPSDSSYQMLDLYLTNLDLELMFENYFIIDIEYIEGWVYNAKKGYEVTPEEAAHMTYDEIVEADGKGSLFYDYIKKWRVEKENNTGARREVAKNMLNMLYGNFGKNVTGATNVPYLDENFVVHFDKVQTAQASGCYCEMAAFITSQCRYHLIKDILKNMDRFVYCDTDSLFLLNGDEEPDLKQDERLFGWYKKEKLIDRIRIVGAKRYIFEGKSKGQEGTFISCCGAPPEIKAQMTFDNFKTGAVFSGKKIARTVRGGKEIVETDYRLEDK